MTMAATARVVAVAEQISARVGSDSVVLDLRSGRYSGLNEVAATVWEFIQQPRSMEEIEQRVTSEFDVGPEQARADLLRLVEQMRDAGLVEVRDAGGM